MMRPIQHCKICYLLVTKKIWLIRGSLALEDRWIQWRAIRVEVCRYPGKFARPLHRSPALREVFKQAGALASVDGGRLRPAHLLLALIERRELMVSSAITKLGHDPEEVLRGLGARLVARRKTPRRKTQDKIKKEEIMERNWYLQKSPTAPRLKRSQRRMETRKSWIREIPLFGLADQWISPPA